MGYLVCVPGALKGRLGMKRHCNHLAIDLVNCKLQYLVKLTMYILPGSTIQLLDIWSRRRTWVPKESHENVYSSTVSKSRKSETAQCPHRWQYK